jgi:hypothetical protein
MEEKDRAKLDLGTSPTNNTAKKLCQPLGNLIGDPASHLYFTERERGKKIAPLLELFNDPIFRLTCYCPQTSQENP